MAIDDTSVMTHPAFTLIRQDHIPSLNLNVLEFRHRVTGARHFHLDSKDSNNAFLVAFPTIPQDSTGVAHILEHTTLCGSQHYPVRDPFFMMIRRSLNTFMNAFTSSDWTAYPFASQNPKDFENLLRVYLDAVFFPLLDPLDFAQEGHRVEFSTADDPKSELEYKGVVYNEMKGAMSSPERQLWQTLQSHLFPTITYHHNSGGDPEEIPKLNYEQLKHFHRTHYHPSNALFMTYGNFPVTEHQAKLEDCALTQFNREEFNTAIPDEQRYEKPIIVTSAYPFEDEEDLSRKSHIVIGWLLGKSADLLESMRTQLLSGVLLDHSASPLRQALETSKLGTAPSELCGLDDETREAVFVCGLEGCDSSQAEAVEKLVFSVLEKVATEGVPLAQVESVLHQLELSQREVGGGRFPYGLQLMVKALSASMHGAHPVDVLDIDPILNQLREQINDPDFIKSLARRLLLNNPHRVRLTMVPDKQLSTQRLANEMQRLSAIKAAMDDQETQQVIERARALKLRQQNQDDPEVLPKVSLEDIPPNLAIPEGASHPINGMPATWFVQGTNGLVYEQLIVELPQLNAESINILPLFCACLTEVGCGTRDYLQTQAWQASVSGGVGARTSVHADLTDLQTIKGFFVLSSKALVRNQQPLSELLDEIFFRARFDELPRIRELIAQIRTYREAQITGNGHVLAMAAASARMGPCGALAQQWSGLDGIKQIKTLDKALNNESDLEDFANRLKQIRDGLTRMPRQLVVVSEAQHQTVIQTTLYSHWPQPQLSPEATEPFGLDPVQGIVKQAWTISTQVNFCAKAYRTVSQNHPDAPTLMVLGPFLRNGYLHRAIREQGGAYGAGAGYNTDTSAFRFFSYRDPRLAATLTDFDHALEWLHTERHEPRQLEEAILGVISDIDRPDSPAGEAIGTFFSTLHGRTPEQRREFRQRILQVKLNDLQRVANSYLQPSAASIAVISNETTLGQQQDLDLEVYKL